MPRLDAARIGVWRDLRTTVDDIARRVDRDLRDEWDISLAWFDVLASLQRLGGNARPLDLAADLRIPASSISRRLDRLEEEGWIARHHHDERPEDRPGDRTGDRPGDRTGDRTGNRRVGITDLRAVDIELTRTGRRLWREMNVSFRRAVQVNFATHLGDDEVAALGAILGLLADSPPDVDSVDGSGDLD